MIIVCTRGLMENRPDEQVAVHKSSLCVYYIEVNNIWYLNTWVVLNAFTEAFCTINVAHLNGFLCLIFKID